VCSLVWLRNRETYGRALAYYQNTTLLNPLQTAPCKICSEANQSISRINNPLDSTSVRRHRSSSSLPIPLLAVSCFASPRLVHSRNLDIPQLSRHHHHHNPNLYSTASLLVGDQFISIQIANWTLDHRRVSCVARGKEDIDSVHRSTYTVSRIDCARIPRCITHHTSPTKTVPSLPPFPFLHIRDHRNERIGTFRPNSAA